jgi:hypothetical protein
MTSVEEVLTLLVGLTASHLASTALYSSVARAWEGSWSFGAFVRVWIEFGSSFMFMRASSGCQTASR